MGCTESVEYTSQVDTKGSLPKLPTHYEKGELRKLILEAQEVAGHSLLLYECRTGASLGYIRLDKKTLLTLQLGEHHATLIFSESSYDSGVSSSYSGYLENKKRFIFSFLSEIPRNTARLVEIKLRLYEGNNKEFEHFLYLARAEKVSQ